MEEKPSKTLYDFSNLINDHPRLREQFPNAFQSFSNIPNIKDPQLREIMLPYFSMRRDLRSWESHLEALEINDRYIKEELARHAETQTVTTPMLEKAFAANNVDFTREVLPLFRSAYGTFTAIWFHLRAAAEMRKNSRKRVQRYGSAVARITEEGSPFPAELRALVRQGYSQLLANCNPRAGEEDLIFWAHRVPKKSVLDRNFTKNPWKQPIWRQLTRQLFTLLTGRGVSQTRAYKLIALLFQSYIPRWFDVSHPEDTVRLCIQSLRKQQHAKLLLPATPEKGLILHRKNIFLTPEKDVVL